MGNLIFGSILILIYTGIIHYLVKTLLTKGTVCHTCKVCPIQSKDGLLNWMKEMEIKR